MGKAGRVEALSRVRRLGNSLWAVIDVAKLEFCRERVDGNEATSLVSAWVRETLIGLPEEERPRGFIGIAGESRFRATVFPESLLSHLYDQVRLLVGALALPGAAPAGVAGPDYRILLNVGPDAATVRAWIEEQQTVSDERSPRESPQPPALPEDYVARYAELRAYLNDARTQVAAWLQPALQRQAESMPSNEYADKQRLASWVNAQLRELGLAIRCPHTGRPAILTADLRDAETGASRFRLLIRKDDGRQSKTISSQSVPTLELMPDEIRPEGRARGPSVGGTTE